MAKAQKEGVNLVSSVGSATFYTFRRNKKKNKGGEKKLTLKKYDPLTRTHVEFAEKKLSKLKKKFKLDKYQASVAAADANTTEAKK